MALVRLGLLLFSAGVAALVVALVMPLTEPEALAAIARHPLGGRLMNASSAAASAIADLLAGVSSSDLGPSLAQYYPLPINASEAATARPVVAPGGSRAAARRRRAGPDLDWAEPEVWRLQVEQLTQPFYTREEVDRLLYWCDSADGRGSAAGDASHSALETNTSGGAAGAVVAAAEARYARLAAWVAANGGAVAAVTMGTDANGERGLHAARDIAEGEMVLSMPIKLGLSIASFRAARMAAAATGHWRLVDDADLFLDALALSYEVAVHGERSPWADHLCMLPRSYGGLPVHASDPRDAALLAQLPSLRRLAAKRRAELTLFGNDLARPSLETLPGGRAALTRLARGNSSGIHRDLWLPLWHWAYAATKTRSVTMAAEDVRYGAGRGGGPGDEGLPSVLRLPLAMLEWVQEVGALLPILDLANHAFTGQGANVAYQILGDSTGTGLAACFMALRPIPAGQPLLFDYTADTEADSGPSCADRWLLEYGFVPPGDDPRRDCDTLEVTAVALAKALRVACPAATLAGAPTTGSASGHPDGEAKGGRCEAGMSEGYAALEARLAARLAQLPSEGLAKRLEVLVRQPDPAEYEDSAVSRPEHVQRRWEVVQWLRVALRDELDGCGGGGVQAGEARVLASVLEALLAAREEQLRAMAEAAKALVDSGGRAERSELRTGLAAVTAGAMRAVQRALRHERQNV